MTRLAASRLSRQVDVGGGQPADPPTAQVNNPTLLNLTISTQNCNSLNVSASAKNTKMKVASIINLNSDVILLSDTRLGNKARLRYKLFHHSRQAKRGVAILIRNELDFTVDKIIKDTEENCIFLDGKISGQKVAIASIYGPNDDNRTFFNFLDNTLLGLRDQPIIIGGDWNTTVSPLPTDVNPDVLNMRTIPSQVRTLWLNNIMEKNDLHDPFRHLNPNMMDFSYSPYGTVRKNRSRIDFFLVTSNILSYTKKCGTVSHLAYAKKISTINRHFCSLDLLRK